MIIDECAAFDIVDHLKLINNKMEDFSVRVRAMQGFIVKSKIILGQLAFNQPAVQKVKFGKNQFMFKCNKSFEISNTLTFPNP